MAQKNKNPALNLVFLSWICTTAKERMFREYNHVLLRHYGTILRHIAKGDVPPVVTHKYLQSQLNENIYGVLAVVPQTARVVGTFHFTVRQTWDNVLTTFTPSWVHVDSRHVSNPCTRRSLQQRMYSDLKTHLLSRWPHGLDPSGNPALILRFDELPDLVSKSIYITKPISPVIVEIG